MNKLLATIVIPVFNIKYNVLIESFNSALNQTISKKLYEIIIVNDCSNSQETLDALKDIEKENITKKFENLCEIRIINNNKNIGVIAVRNSSVSLSKGEFIVFLDGDDVLSKNYLLYGISTAISHKKIGFVYPNILRFGFENDYTPAQHFDIKRLLRDNYVSTGSIVRKEAWKRSKGQFKKIINNKTEWHEDWAGWVSILSKGYFAVPNNEITYKWRSQYRSRMTRSVEEHLASQYLHYRFGIRKSLSLIFSKLNFERAKINSNHTINIFDPRFYLRRLIGQSIRKLLVDIPQLKSNLKIRDLLIIIFRPKKFINILLEGKRFPNATEIYCYLEQKINYECPIFENIFEKFSHIKEEPCSFFIGHFWYRQGGAEQVLLDLIKFLKRDLKNNNITDVVVTDYGENKYFKDKFSKFCVNNISLEKINFSHIGRLYSLWFLICQMKPKCIFIMSNPYLYTLVPLVKRYMPNTKIIDLNHCINYGSLSWFDLSDYYKSQIDMRIVLTNTFKSYLSEKFNENPKKILVLTNQSRYKSKRTNSSRNNKQFIPDIKKRKNKSNKKSVIGFISRLVPDKRPYDFIKLAESCISEKNFKFNIAGDGVLLEQIKKDIKQIPNIKYKGFFRNSNQFLKNCDLVVFTSIVEGLPLVLLECASLGIPVIAPNIIGFREPIRKGNFGLLFTPNYDGDDYLKIKKLLTNQHFNKLISLGKNGLPYMDKFHPKYKSRKYLKNIFLNLISETSLDDLYENIEKYHYSNQVL